MTKPTAGDVVHEALDYFVSICRQVIKNPNQKAFNGIGFGFNRRAGKTIFSNAVDAIDGCHVNISVPRARDSSGKFTFISSGFPGTVYDQRDLRPSSLYKNGNFPPKFFYYLGDIGYSCRLVPVEIITPYKVTSESSIISAQRQVNFVPIKSENEIEKEVDRFFDVIQSFAWESTPKLSHRKENSVIYPIEIRELVQQKRKARKKCQTTLAPQDKTALNGLYTKIKAIIKVVKNVTVGKYFSSLAPTKDSDYNLFLSRNKRTKTTKNANSSNQN